MLGVGGGWMEWFVKFETSGVAVDGRKVVRPPRREAVGANK